MAQWRHTKKKQLRQRREGKRKVRQKGIFPIVEFLNWKREENEEEKWTLASWVRVRMCAHKLFLTFLLLLGCSTYSRESEKLKTQTFLVVTKLHSAKYSSTSKWGEHFFFFVAKSASSAKRRENIQISRTNCDPLEGMWSHIFTCFTKGFSRILFFVMFFGVFLYVVRFCSLTRRLWNIFMRMRCFVLFLMWK